MRITERTPKTLKLKANRREKLQKWACLMVGGGHLFAGLFASLTTVGVSTLSCDRLEPTQVSCTIIASSVVNEEVITIRSLQSVRLQIDNGSDGVTRRIILIGKEG